MKLAFVISPSFVWISSISARPMPCAVPPSIWPCDGERVERLADVLGGADPDDARQAELDVHLGDDPHRRAGERDVRPLSEHLPVLGIERERRAVPVVALEVDVAARSLALRERVAARELDGARRHPRHARRG